MTAASAVLVALFALVSTVFAAELDLYVNSATGVDSSTCGLAKDTPCQVIDTVLDLHVRAEGETAARGTDVSGVVVHVAAGKSVSTFPMSVFYSRFDFADDKSLPIRFVVDANDDATLVTLNRDVHIGGEKEVLEGTLGHVSFEGFEFKQQIVIADTAEAFQISFINCRFVNSTDNVRPFDLDGIVVDARTTVEIVDSVFDARGVRARRGNELRLLNTVFTGTIEPPVRTVAPTTGETSNSTAKPTPMAMPRGVVAFVQSAAQKTSIVDCKFRDIESHGDATLIMWDGELHRHPSGGDMSLPPLFEVVDSVFERVLVHHGDGDSIGGALFFYDCIDGTTDELAPCRARANVFRNTRIDKCHTGHALLIVSGGELTLRDSVVRESQSDANEHSGAVLVIDHGNAVLLNTTLDECGEPAGRAQLRSPHTWQLAGGIVAIDSTVSLEASRLRSLRGWQSGVAWCESSTIVTDIATVDALDDNTGTDVPYIEDRATAKVFGNATGNTDRNWSCGIGCTIRENQRPLCPKTRMGRPGEQRPDTDDATRISAVSLLLALGVLLFGTLN